MSPSDLRALPALPEDNALVIGEGVVLDLQATTFATRLLSSLIDYSVQLVLLIALWIASAALLARLDLAAAMAMGVLSLVAVLVGLPTLVEALTRGRSIGRFALGLRVVRDDGGPIRLRHALIRSLVGIFELWGTGGAVALICSFLNSRGKRVGDLLAGTYVVRERGVRPQPLVLQPVGHLRTWARSADIARLPDELAMSVRQFLQRRAGLSPYARAHLAAELAGEVAARVAPQPPPGTAPEDLLVAVLAERRDRELARLQREREAAYRREATVHRLPYAR